MTRLSLDLFRSRVIIPLKDPSMPRLHRGLTRCDLIRYLGADLLARDLLKSLAHAVGLSKVSER